MIPGFLLFMGMDFPNIKQRGMYEPEQKAGREKRVTD